MIRFSLSNQLAVCQRRCSLGSIQANIETLFSSSSSRDLFDILRSVTFAESPYKDDRYAELKKKVKNDSYQDIATEVIRKRLLENGEAFKLRQRAKAAIRHLTHR